MLRRPEYLGGILAVALTLLSAGARADSGLLNESLGRWLDTEVLPQLGEVLGQHPRFKGETIRLVSLTGSQPTAHASRLHQAVQAHLTQRLLRSSGVRIAWADQPDRSCGVSEQAVYLLGVEIERDGSRYHKLNIGMIDVAESVWVSGVNHSWRGRLTATETAALGQTVPAAPQGTLDNPLPIAAASQIADAMHRHLACAHPEGLDGPVFLKPADSPQLNGVIANLRSTLATTPIAALTGTDDSAEWILSVSATPAGTDKRVQQFSLQLTEQNNRTTQQVATVYVAGLSSRRALPAADTRIALSSSLLSNMRLETATRAGICDHRRADAEHCAEVSFDLLQSAYLFVLSSRDGTLSTTACGSRLVEASSGERRFRVRVPRSAGDRPEAGVYAIAIRDRTTAKALSRHIRTGICSRPLNRSAAWLNELDTLLDERSSSMSGATQWRAIHLVNAATGIERL